jgi:hypothetical protein
MSVKGEKYASKSAMMKHEKMEPASARKKEYGSAKSGLFGTKKKAVAKKMGKKK